MKKKEIQTVCFNSIPNKLLFQKAYLKDLTYVKYKTPFFFLSLNLQGYDKEP